MLNNNRDTCFNY